MEEKKLRYKRGLLVFRIFVILIWIGTIANIYQIFRLVSLTIAAKDTYVYVFTTIMVTLYIFWIIMLTLITNKLAFGKSVND